MAGFFKNNTYGLSERERLTAKYNTARWNLLLVVAFTLVNIFILAFGGGTYFLFSASVPFLITTYGVILCGKMPAGFYEELGVSQDMLLPQGAMTVFVVIAVVITSLYFVFWLFSKKKSGFMVAALVFFAIDSLVMLSGMGISIDTAIDILMHAWVLYYLISGVSAHKKLKALPEEDEPVLVYTGDGVTEVAIDDSAEEVVAEEVSVEKNTEDYSVDDTDKTE